MQSTSRAGAAGVHQAGRNDGPPDLDELWRDFNRKLSGLFGGKGGGPRGNGSGDGGPNFQPDMKSAGIGVGLIAGVVALIWLGSGFFIVQEGQQAVVTSFGRYSHTVGCRLPVAHAVSVPGARDGAGDAAALGRGRAATPSCRPPACATRRC